MKEPHESLVWRELLGAHLPLTVETPLWVAAPAHLLSQSRDDLAHTELGSVGALLCYCLLGTVPCLSSRQ